MEMLKNFLFEEDGQTLVEYGLIIVLIALAVIVGMKFLASSINNTYSNAGTRLATP